MRRTLMALIAVMTCAIPAAAQQGPGATPSQSIGAGAHWALPYAEPELPGAQASWRRWLSPRLGVAAELRWWGRHTSGEFDTPAQTGPEGVAVPRMQGVDDRRVSSYGFGVNVLARSTAGRLSLVGGLGPGFFMDRTAYERRIDARHMSGGSTIRSLGLHSMAEVDVQATDRMSVFVGVRIELRSLGESESLSGYPAAGVRFAF